MPAILISRSGSTKGRNTELTKQRTRLGRKRDNDVVFSDDGVSSYHAEIRRRGTSYHFVDLESTNGSFVNGRRVDQVVLENRDKIELGENGPLLEFRSSGSDLRPMLHPLSGEWETDADIPIEHSQTALGRSSDNDVVVGRVAGSVVSSRHAVIVGSGESWEIEDLESSNGTYVNGRRISKARLYHGDRVALGERGPSFEFRLPGARRSSIAQARESEQMFKKLQRAAKGGRAGEQTMLFLQAANKYYKRRRWPLLAACAFILAGALVAWYLYYQKMVENRRIRASAQEIFYSIRSIQAELVRYRDSMPPEESSRRRNIIAKNERLYDQFLRDLGVYEGRPPVEQAVMRLARRLGETDLEIPPDFIQATVSYVDKWRRTSRLRTSLDRARERGLPRIIRTALDQYGLPRELLFIPLQESGYDRTQVGPPTHYGIAKGLWQFIPSTALDYNLRLGPYKDEPRYDPLDQRHDELESTHAAVRYIADLYASKAAASGLLVIAAYNFGQTRIIKKLDDLPDDPRQRNFWNFYRKGWIPAETRDYVMYIFSAALICEKSDLFQMNIEPILADW